jgi:hypothetical protein
MNVDARRQMEQAADAMARTTGRDQVLYKMPNGSYEMAHADSPRPEGAEPVYTATAFMPFPSLLGGGR